MRSRGLVQAHNQRYRGRRYAGELFQREKDRQQVSSVTAVSQYWEDAILTKVVMILQSQDFEMFTAVEITSGMFHRAADSETKIAAVPSTVSSTKAKMQRMPPLPFSDYSVFIGIGFKFNVQSRDWLDRFTPNLGIRFAVWANTAVRLYSLTI